MNPVLSRRTLALAGAAVLLLALGALGGHSWAAGSSSDGSGSGSGSGVDSGSGAASSVTVGAVARRASATHHNDADVTFARSMTPHHTQAIAMARLARTRAGSAQVKALAARIEAAQGPEINQLAGWLTTWGEAEARSTGTMRGMMSSGDLRSLAAERGAAFDRGFVTMMIEHHTGAISMAHDELVAGRSAEALGLASSVQVTQQAEVGQMRTMLRRLPE